MATFVKALTPKNVLKYCSQTSVLSVTLHHLVTTHLNYAPRFYFVSYLFSKMFFATTRMEMTGSQ